MALTVYDISEISVRQLRPFLGGRVTLRTPSSLLQGTLLSCVRDSVWLVVDDADVVVRLDDITWVDGN